MTLSTKPPPVTFSIPATVSVSDPTDAVPSVRFTVAPASSAERLRVSVPSPPSIVSSPAPIWMMSSPAPPSILSSPAPPTSKSSLAPPIRVSVPEPPTTRVSLVEALASPLVLTEKTSEAASIAPSPSRSISTELIGDAA